MINATHSDGATYELLGRSSFGLNSPFAENNNGMNKWKSYFALH